MDKSYQNAKEEKLTELVGKFAQRVFKFFIVIIFSPFVVIMRLLKPFILIRLGPLRSERIGHFIANTEVYLSECDRGLHGDKYVDVFYHKFPVSNEQLKKMWDRTLHVLNFARYVDFANRKIPGGASPHYSLAEG